MARPADRGPVARAGEFLGGPPLPLPPSHPHPTHSHQVLLRPEDLNSLFNPVGLNRLALRESPMLGTCCLFNLDSTLLPSWSVDSDAWKTVEEEEGVEEMFEIDERAGMKVEEIGETARGARRRCCKNNSTLRRAKRSGAPMLNEELLLCDCFPRRCS